MIPRARSRTVRWLLVTAGLLIVGGLGLAATRAARSTVTAMGDAEEIVPTATVVRGPLDLTIHMTGELRAASQQGLSAPPVGASLRILTLVDSGSVVTSGELIVSFDPADQRYALEQAESELLEAVQNIRKRRADIGAQEASDQVALLTARFNVRRAALDAAVDRELIPANEYRIRQVSLEEARRTLARTEQDVEARATVSTAGLSVLEEARMKAQLAADRARQNMEMLEIRAPLDGVVSVRENLDGQTVLFGGMMLPPYRVGDTANPGRPIVDIFDLSRMEIRASVNEQDRINLAVGQPVVVRADGIPGFEAPGRVTAISGLGRPVMREGPLRRFDVTCVLDHPDPRLRPGTSVGLSVTGVQQEDQLVVPRQAVFEQDGQSIVFVRTTGAFEPRPVKVLHRGESQAAIDGVEVGVELALIRPDAVSLAAARPVPQGAGAPAVVR